MSVHLCSEPSKYYNNYYYYYSSCSQFILLCCFWVINVSPLCPHLPSTQHSVFSVSQHSMNYHYHYHYRLSQEQLLSFHLVNATVAICSNQSNDPSPASRLQMHISESLRFQLFNTTGQQHESESWCVCQPHAEVCHGYWLGQPDANSHMRIHIWLT